MRLVTWPGIIQQYQEFLPVSRKTPRVTIGEGATPLLKSNVLSSMVGAQVFLKFDGANPTNSYLDRGVALATAKALEDKKSILISITSGARARAVAAFAARTGMRALILVPEDELPLREMDQALEFGATVVPIKGKRPKLQELAAEVSYRLGKCAEVDSDNQYHVEALKTAAYEICDQLRKRVPDYHCLSAAYHETVLGYSKGYREYNEFGRVKGVPKLIGFYSGEFHLDEFAAHRGKRGRKITGVNEQMDDVENKVNEVLAAEAGLHKVTDEDLNDARALLAKREGLLVEKEAAASVAGLLQWSKSAKLTKDNFIICDLPIHGNNEFGQDGLWMPSGEAVRSTAKSIIDVLEEPNM